VEERQIWYSIQPAAYARVTGVATVAQILLSQARRQRRSHVQAPGRGVAVYPLLQADGCAGTQNDRVCRNSISREGEILCRNAPRCRSRGIKLRSLVPALRSSGGRKRAGLPV